jgi:benzoyl-CoA reductase subunit D
MPLTAGIDVGSSSIKCAIMQVTNGDEKVLALQVDRIRRRDLKTVIQENYTAALAEAGVEASDVDYVATTGEGDLVDFRTGHFYSMTTHARGALFLRPTARAVLDLGALHARATKMDHRSKVLQYSMTSQCASGSGQFLENIARYLGVSLEEVGALSMQATQPEMVSSICAVLSETDVINMVSRGIATPNILKGIHLSIANRLVKLMRALNATGEILVTGGLANDPGMIATLQEQFDADGAKTGKPSPLPVLNSKLQVSAHEHSIIAGAIGAALWGAFRFEKLHEDDLLSKAA